MRGWMKIIDPLVLPILLFLGFGVVVLTLGQGLTNLEYVIVLALLLAAVFGSIILFQRRQTPDEK